MLITSLDNSKVKEWKKLNSRKYREQTGLFLIEGEHLVLEAYKMGYLKELILEENESFNLDIKDIYYVTSDVLKKVSDLDNPSSIIGICEKKENNVIGDKLLLLDSLQDPGNLGTIIRSAVAFNIDTIVLGNNTVDVYNSKCIRASQGMLFHINIIEKDLISFIPELKTQGYKILGTNVDGGKDLKTLSKPSKYALIMGNEGNGVDDKINKLCDEQVYIKMNNECESLNVAIACSIIIYQLSE